MFRGGLVFGDENFDGGFGRHFGEVLGDAGERLGSHDGDDDDPREPREIDEGEEDESDDLKKEAGGEGALEAAARSPPAAEEVGEDAAEFVEEKEGGEGNRVHALRVEVQEHEHAEGAIGEGEAPVGCGDDGVGALVHFREREGVRGGF